MTVLREMTNRLSKFRLIARKARENPEEKFTSLAHYLSEEYLIDSYRHLNKSASSGIDGQDYYNYELNIINSIENLHHRLRNGEYEAPPNKRVWIDKGDGKKRPLGISTVEDKIVQKAVTDILNLIYEQDFYDFSHGFRLKRSAHQALSQLHGECMKWDTKWLIDADIQGCFDNFDHQILMDLLKKRIKDKNILKLIDLWLKAGVVDGESMHTNTEGTPQGNIISPLLCNVYLHYVLDEWIEETIKPLLKGRVFIIRYADDFIIGFSHQEDAIRVMQTLPKRMGKYGLTIHPEKSKLMRFAPKGKAGRSETFDFLGFTHYWTKSQKGKYVVKRRTKKKSFNKSIKNLYDTCRNHRHEKLKDQFKGLKSKLQGMYNYYGIRGNFIRIDALYRNVIRFWFKWLNRRSQRKSYTWEGYKELLKHFPLPKPKIVHFNV